MKQSRVVMQVLICIVIVIVCGVAALLIRGYFFKDEEKHIVVSKPKEKYEYNEYRLVNVTTEVLLQKYFQDFREKAMYYPEEAYELLDDDTKGKYENYSDFEKYINDNYVKIGNSYISKYSVQRHRNKDVYIIVDQFNNKYTFTAKAVLLYKVNIEFYDEMSGIFE